MSLVNTIIKIIEDNLKVPCLFDDWNRLNKETSKLRKSIEDHDYKFPAVYIVIPSQGTIDTRFGRYRETTQLNINFVIETLERADFDGIENESRIEQMKQLAIRFLHFFNQSDFFESLPDTIEFRNLYMITDNSLTGVSITILAKELIGTCFDEIEEPEPAPEVLYYIDPETQELYMVTVEEPDPITDVANFEVEIDTKNLIKETEVEYTGADFELNSEGNLIVIE